MLAKELIDRIERLGLLDQEIIEALREQLQQSGARVTPEAVAKLLVDNGQLTSFQATKLIGELRQSEYETPEPDLTDGIFPGDEVMAAEVIDDGVMEAVPVPADVTPVATAAPVGEAMPVDPATRPVRRRPPPPNDNVWDSFKIYGWAGIIVLLLLIGGAIYWILNQEGVDAAYARADEYYKMQRFDDAQVEFADFLESYPSDPKHSSSARVKITMAKLYKAASFTQEPWKGTEVAVKELPKIIQEPGLDNERADLADLLVDIADNITNEADKASDTKRKKMLLDKLEKHDVLIDDPAYIPGSLRTALAVKIKGVEESRGRVARDISRNVRLDKATQEMEAALAKQETKQAYDIRSALLQDFPELYDNERLQKLIIGASEIQQNLVAPATNLPKVSKGSANVDPVKTIVLTTQSGRRAPGLAGEVFYLRAGGSVMAFDGETGGLRWRRFVGYAEDLPPVRIFGDSGVLLSDSQTDSILRCDSEKGDVIWRAEIGERFLRPTSLRDSLFVTTPSGTILHQDVNSGDTKWAARIPQSLTAPPGINREREAQKVYQAGGHSNIYVLDLNNGSCVESFYLGHGAGTIAVPPVPLLGHVFVIENVDASEALVHILRVDPDGTNMRIAQPPVRLTGNVIEPAEIIRNRLAILTDRGQVKILDIEVTAAEKQVTESAVQQPFYDQPTATKMAFSDAMLWITGTQIGRYDLQYSSGRIVGKWNKHDGDAFIGRPM
ncbi:MAG: PQQ-binding-like beta-propeller repeat protein, partial [Planctomycetota bacterium]